MIFLNNESRKISKDLANEFGVNFEEYGYNLNGGKAARKTAQAAFKTESIAWSKNLFKPLERVFTKPERPILVEDGIGAVLDTMENNQHVFPILRGDVGTHSRNSNQTGATEYGMVSGNQLTIVAGYQTQYNQRVVISGSTKMCSNAAMMATRDIEQGLTIQSSSNYVLCTELVEWNMQERGVVRVDNIKHRKVGDEWTGANPENYKREVDIEYFSDIWEKKNGQWVPFVADDVQFQFTMMDPYYQVALEQKDTNSATYMYQLKTPWRLGIFKFIIDFKRYGFTYIDNKLEVSVIQLRHDEFPRFETTGFPYFANVFVLMASSFLFVIHFAFSDFSKVKGVKLA